MAKKKKLISFEETIWSPLVKEPIVDAYENDDQLKAAQAIYEEFEGIEVGSKGDLDYFFVGEVQQEVQRKIAELKSKRKKELIDIPELGEISFADQLMGLKDTYYRILNRGLVGVRGFSVSIDGKEVEAESLAQDQAIRALVKLGPYAVIQAVGAILGANTPSPEEKKTSGQ